MVSAIIVNVVTVRQGYGCKCGECYDCKCGDC